MCAPLFTKHMFSFEIQECIIHIINAELLKFGMKNFLFKFQPAVVDCCLFVKF